MDDKKNKATPDHPPSDALTDDLDGPAELSQTRYNESSQKDIERRMESLSKKVAKEDYHLKELAERVEKDDQNNR